MSDRPSIKFQKLDMTPVAERESATIPRIGETVWLQSKTWTVVGVDYLYPTPGSMDYNAGKRRPLVTISVEAGRR